MSSTGSRSRRTSGGERVFTDDDGRLWNAVLARDGGAYALVFSCITDSRLAARALELAPDCRLADVADDTLRAWLRDAPRMGRLTE